MPKVRDRHTNAALKLVCMEAPGEGSASSRSSVLDQDVEGTVSVTLATVMIKVAKRIESVRLAIIMITVAKRTVSLR